LIPTNAFYSSFYNGKITTPPSVDRLSGEVEPWFTYMPAETNLVFRACGIFWPKGRACEITRVKNWNKDFRGVCCPPPVLGGILPWLIVHQTQFLLSFAGLHLNENDGLQPNLVFVDSWAVGDVLDVVER
jgi:hypothetical protein